ncbi:c-type cytochrome [bacterium]|nr:c-type cytochrome [bacterium]
MLSNWKQAVTISLLITGWVTTFAAEPVPPPPLQMAPATEPSEAAATIQLQDGFRAELIAAEPLVTDPVDIAYDENGLAYVCEMTDYPYADAADDRPWEEQPSAPIGRVRVLQDTNGDGIYDRSFLFAEGLSWPAGIACWKGGVYVAATPDLLYLKDTDGDHRADVRRVVFQGFCKYNVQAVMNNLEWGLDHHLYAAGSSNGGSITNPARSTITLGRNDFRIDPTKETFELVAGGARFGNSFDDWGQRFLCNIRNPVQHVLFPAHYLQRNRALSLPSSLHDAAAAGDAVAVYRVSPPEPWRVIHAERLANSFEKSLFDSTQATGYVTSSSGVTIYRGAAYPPEFAGNAFVGEVSGNLAIRYVLQPEAVTFTATRPYHQKDFLASTDNWFRPVNFANAPDGTLHVLDMYRQTIEHPWSLPDDLQQRLDLTAGRDRGRIYRLLPPQYATGFQPPPSPRLGEASTAELVEQLANPNGWWRDTAHRLIYERQDAAAVPLLRDLLRQHSQPVARLHALWSLEGLSALEPTDLVLALKDHDFHVQAVGVQLSEDRLKQDDELRRLVTELAGAPQMPVRYQVAFSLGAVPSAEVSRTLAQLLRQDGHDAWMRAAVLSSLSGQESAVLTELLNDPAFVLSDAGQSLTEELFQVVAGNGSRETLLSLLSALSQPAYETLAGKSCRDRLLLAIGRGLKRQGKPLNWLVADDSQPGSLLIEVWLAVTLAAVTQRDTPADQMVSMIARLEYSASDQAITALQPLVSSKFPVAVQTAAITTLTTFSEDRVADDLLSRYQSLSPELQRLVVERLLSRTNWLTKVFAAIESGDVAANLVPGVRQDIYRKSPNAAIREQAERLFATPKATARSEIVEHMQRALPEMSDKDRGLAVYRKQCANCHRLGTEGYEVGPHLSTVRNRSASELVVNILDPNREVSPNYLTYVVVTTNGVQQTGVVVNETATGLTLRGTDRKEIAVLRDDIEELQNTGQSLMPVGLEKSLTPQDLADLVALLQQQ